MPKAELKKVNIVHYEGEILSVQVPKGVVVIVKNYDCDSDVLEIMQDEAGDNYQEEFWETNCHD